MMPTDQIISRLPYRGPVSRRAWCARVYRAITRHGLQPIRAQYDTAGNCTICGEAGRCPGWHVSADITAKGGAQ